ncbi:MAG: hypothetical protein U1E27_14530 [Kiritimatiellia bacterium]|nr:hypothetical protein [Kiritimatiellia bacterium]
MTRCQLNQGRLRRDAPLCAPAVIGSLALHLVIGGACLGGGLFRTAPSAPARSPVEPPLVSILLQPLPPLHSLEPMSEWTDPPPTLPDLLAKESSVGVIIVFRDECAAAGRQRHDVAHRIAKDVVRRLRTAVHLFAHREQSADSPTLSQ